MASPLHSNCIIKLNSSSEEGGISVSVNYANFLSLDMDRIWGDSANSFTLKLLDKTAYEVEAILLKGNRNIYMKYYTTDSNEVETSKEFEGNIWDYSIDFINDKTILTITGTCGVKVKDIYTDAACTEAKMNPCRPKDRRLSCPCLRSSRTSHLLFLSVPAVFL